MLLEGVVSLLGGSLIRTIWGEISAAYTKHQDNKNELERMSKQGELDDAAHKRQMEALRVQKDLGVDVIHVQSDAYAANLAADEHSDVVKATTKLTGIWFLDIWNGSIRPAVATWSIAMLTVSTQRNNWVLDETGVSVCSAALGIYLADRALFKRGK